MGTSLIGFPMYCMALRPDNPTINNFESRILLLHGHLWHQGPEGSGDQ